MRGAATEPMLTEPAAASQSQEAVLAFPRSPRVELLSEEVLPEPRRRSAKSPPSRPAAAEPPAGAATGSAPTAVPAPTADLAQQRARIGLWAALGTFEAIAKLLAVRLILMLAVAGAFALGFATRDWLGFAVLAVYSAFVILPLVWLDRTTRG